MLETDTSCTEARSPKQFINWSMLRGIVLVRKIFQIIQCVFLRNGASIRDSHALNQTMPNVQYSPSTFISVPEKCPLKAKGRSLIQWMDGHNNRKNLFWRGSPRFITPTEMISNSLHLSFKMSTQCLPCWKKILPVQNVIQLPANWSSHVLYWMLLIHHTLYELSKIFDYLFSFLHYLYFLRYKFYITHGNFIFP